MKKLTTCIISCIFLCHLAYGQKVIQNPVCGFSTTSTVKITRIELNDTSTILSFKTSGKAGYAFSIPQKTFIKPVDGEKMFIKSAIDIPLSKLYKFEEEGDVEYKLVFPKIDKATSVIDYGEDGGSWFIYDIHLEKIKSGVPEQLLGNWFNTSSGDWEYSFFENYAIYNKQKWEYASPAGKSSGQVVLKNGPTQVILVYKPGKGGKFKIGLPSGVIQEYANNTKELNPALPANDKPFTEPVFKMDSAVYHGYIAGFNSRIGIKTGTVYVNDIITDNQNSYLIKIENDGYFHVKVPLYYPHEVYVRADGYAGSVYLEPGTELFQLITNSTRENKIFIGESARLNTELANLEDIRRPDYNDVQKVILDMSVDQYKEYCLKKKQEKLNEFEKIKQTRFLLSKTMQVVNMDIEYGYASLLLEYQWHYTSAYRKKNSIPMTERELNIKIGSPQKEYYSFINESVLNNVMAVISVNYGNFVNRFKYIDILREKVKAPNLLDVAEELEKTGYTFSGEEKNILDTFRLINNVNNSGINKEFKDKYGDQQIAFTKKYQHYYTEIIKAKKEPVTLLAVAKLIESKGETLTAEEKKLTEAYENFQNSEEVKKNQDLLKRNQPGIQHFMKEKNIIFSNLYFKAIKDARYENLKSYFNIQSGLIVEILNAQDDCRPIAHESTPVSEDQLSEIQKQYSNQFFREYIAYCNNLVIARLEKNKNASGYVVNETPKTEADVLFDSIMKKYRNKVVYVDFWATWCAPCRSGIERIKPLKEELANENVEFVYITGPSSPQKTWENMIPEIKGEHYRVSNDEWNYLCSKFNISGIPHYALVGKNGEILSPKLGHMENGSLKAELMKYLK